MKIRMTRKELGSYFLGAVKAFGKGLARIVWSAFLLLANITIVVTEYIAGLIRKAPVVSVGVTFAVMLVASVVSYADMKTKLTTAEWERDSVAIRLDSALTMSGTKPTYYKYERIK